MEKSRKTSIKGTGLVAQQEIRIAMASFDQRWLRIGAHQKLVYYNQKQRSNKEPQRAVKTTPKTLCTKKERRQVPSH